MRLYIHWPFCVSRCPYCDFNSRVAAEPVRDEYRGALLSEAEMWAGWLDGYGTPLRSLYLGGGTPSTLSGEDVAALIARISAAFGVSAGAEVSVEVNPATWAPHDFAAARRGGVNRFSIGVQSLDGAVLSRLGRAHGAGEAEEAVSAALYTGAAVGVDLIYGAPGITMPVWEDTLLRVLELRPHHVSIYALTLGAKTPLAAAVRRGHAALPDEDACADQYLHALEVLSEAGYVQYEISNLSLPGYHSSHNLAYWKREEYLGLGAGAHSFIAGCRFHNTPSVARYVGTLRGGGSPLAGWEVPGGDDERLERIMLGLRTSRGIAAGLLTRGAMARAEELEGGGLLRRRGGRLALTPRGMLVSNAVIADLLPPPP